MSSAWSKVVKLHELGRGPLRLHLEPDPEQRKAIAKQLGLQGLLSLKADLTAKSWLDGVEVTGRFEAVVEQICGVSLDAFEQAVAGDIEVRAVPATSPHGQTVQGGDLELNFDGPDAPDILTNDIVDLAGYVVEHLALEIDPFPRKPGATFEYQSPVEETSPFAALKTLTEPKA